MDFGISLDPSSVSQRHCLEDSDEEDEDSKESETAGNVGEAFKLPDQREQLPPAANLIIAIGHPAVVFTKIYLDLEALPSCTISTDVLTVFKDKHFTTGSYHQGDEYIVSEGFEIKCTGSDLERYLLCTHEQLLNSQYCNLWCSKVQTHMPGIMVNSRSHLGHWDLSRLKGDSIHTDTELPLNWTPKMIPPLLIRTL